MTKINSIEATDLQLSGRAGLSFTNRFLEESGVLDLLTDTFPSLTKSKKGLSTFDFFKQMGAFFMNGEHLRICEFDRLADDDSYAKVIELDPEDLSSSDSIRRKFEKFNVGEVRKFHSIFQKIFKLIIERHVGNEITMMLDSMVLDNNDSKQKQGCTPTYKKVLGYQPLHLIFNGFILDMAFRGGKTHGNSSDTAKNMIVNAINLIREIKGNSVRIIFNMDSGFMDQKLFDAIEENGAYFICGGKKYKNITDSVESTPIEEWSTFKGKRAVFKFYEFDSKCNSWDKEYRTIYTFLLSKEDGQCVLNFGDSDNVIYTNIKSSQYEFEYSSRSSRGIIRTYHSRGADELPHRGIKEFGIEQLPFKDYFSNHAFYAMMTIFYNMFELYKEDVIEDADYRKSYANRIRRKFIDIAGYVVTTGRSIILKINHAIKNAIDLAGMWYRCNNLNFRL